MEVKKFPVVSNHKTKVVKIRSDRSCFLSSWKTIQKGGEMLAVKILPGSATGQLWDLTVPMTTYFCGECPLCHSQWAQDPNTDDSDPIKESV